MGGFKMQKVIVATLFIFSILQAEAICTKQTSSQDIELILETNDDVNCMLILANRYMKEGELSQGFFYLSKANMLDPKKVQADKSSKVLKLALSLSELENDAITNSNVDSWNKLGDEYFEMKAFKEAKDAYFHSLEVNSDQNEIRILFAITLQALKQHYRAVIELEKVLEVDRQNIHANYYVGKILKNNVGDLAKAANHFHLTLRVLKNKSHDIKNNESIFFIEDSEKELQLIKNNENEK